MRKVLFILVLALAGTAVADDRGLQVEIQSPSIGYTVEDGATNAMSFRSTVLSWFADRGIRKFDAALSEIAHVNMQCNLVKEVAALDRGLSSRLKGLVLSEH